MRVSISNIGSIKYSSINISPLTVIAGENDCGKSTIGKTIFAIIQAFAKYRSLSQTERIERVRRELERILIEFRRVTDIEEVPELRRLLSPIQIFRRIELDPDGLIFELQNIIKHFVDLNYNQDDAKAKHFERMLARVERVKFYLDEEPSNKDAIMAAITKSLSSEFNGEIKNKSNNEFSGIEFSDGESNLFKIKIDSEVVVEFDGYETIPFEDSTFVDGTAIIQYHKFSKIINQFGESALFNRAVPFHVTDLGQKLTLGKIGILGSEKSRMLNLSQTYKGKLYYDSEENGFFLDKGNYKISSGNIASGVKAFGVLDMLVDAGCVREGTLLILDEPETNLHPKWQVDFARALVKLVKSGATILVTSHSPYMVEALKGFSDREKITSSFYLASRDSVGEIKFSDTSDDISNIIHALAEPLRNLMDEISDDF